LMENAGRSMAEAVIRCCERSNARKRPTAAIFCGKGNNGGDGLACARYLITNKIKTAIYICTDKSFLKGDSLTNLRILYSYGIKPHFTTTRKSFDRLKKNFIAGIIVDAIFGIGFTGKATGIYKDIIEFINAQGAYILAVDTPSGLNATTGKVDGLCVMADNTIACGFAKKGFYKREGPEHCGRVSVVDIGLPEELTRGRR
ncbi:MAG: NAD(P)H-hydrate epimerase, partial [Candidatus Omnitrophica bacterium]|nr:NAD(P)H-hydrate epimerase [Candidatus Omnitrophota bacterium]